MSRSFLSIAGVAVLAVLLAVAAPCRADSITVNAATKAWLSAWITAIPNLQIIWLNPDICARSGIQCVSATNSINLRLDAVTSSGFNFIGTLPEVDSSIDGSQIQITTISVNGKKRFTGTLPASWSRLTRLQTLDVSNTRMSGLIPDSLGSLANLVSVDFSNSYFCYGMPNWNATGMPKLSQAIFTKNNMRGAFASSWSTFSPSLSISLTGNKLCGCMPSSWNANPSLVAAAKAMNSATVDSCTLSCDAASLGYCPAPPASNGARHVAVGTAVLALIAALAALVL